MSYEAFRTTLGARPTSFRLPEGLIARLDDEAVAAGTSVTTLVANCCTPSS